MGLDIYVRWGEAVDVGEGYKDFIEWDEGGKYRLYYNAQITGFVSAPRSGYLRESWGSLSWVYEMAQKYSAPYPYNFWPDWNGYNGEQLDLTENGRLDGVLEFRDKVLTPWLDSCSEVYDSLSAEDRDEFDLFVKRVRDVIEFIDFVQHHRDKPNLTIVFG